MRDTSHPAADRAPGAPGRAIRARRRRLAPADRRELLLAAAAAIFAEHGYNGARVEQIAERAGVSPGLLYRHFPGKRELYQELVRLGGERLVEQTARAASPGQEGAERLERGLDAFLSFVEEHRDVWRMLIRNEAEPSVAAVRDAMRRQAVVAVTELLALDPAASEQQIPKSQLEQIAVVIVGSAQALAGWWTSRPEVARAELVETVMNTLWVGLDRLRAGQRYRS